MYPRNIPSPISSTAIAKLIETRAAAPIIQLYRDQFNYDATEDFAGNSEIAIYECEASGYRFFYPHTLQGKERLYRKIEQFDWCYEEGKWEHETVSDRVMHNASVLDVGCGRGAFLAKVMEKRSPNVTGIELNQSAAMFARKRGINVLECLVGEIGANHFGSYDVVTAFQVLEHIADPVPFLRDCIQAAKPGGLLVVAVPNNAGFLKFDPETPLNGPPHHVGLWTPSSLAALQNFLSVELVSIEEEPLRELAWYQNVMERRYLPKRWQRSLYYRLGFNRIVQRFILDNSDSISGHTVIAYFRRNAT